MIMTTLAETSPVLQEVIPHPMFHIGSYAVTNAHILTLVTAILMFVVFYWLAKRMTPSGASAEDYVTKGSLAQMIEVMVVFCREEIARPQLGELTDRYIYYVWTTFFFVLFGNLIGLLPIGPILNLVTYGWKDSHPHLHETLGFFNGPPTGNISVTAALALISLFVMVAVPLRHKKLGYFKSFVLVPIEWSPMLPIALLMLFIEVVSVFIKTLALCIRLFANMIAGHMVVAALIGMIFIFGATNALVGYTVSVPSILISVLLTLMEVLICVLQAFIFTFLTVIFVAMGMGHGDEEHAHEHTSKPAKESAGFSGQNELAVSASA